MHGPFLGQGIEDAEAVAQGLSQVIGHWIADRGLRRLRHDRRVGPPEEEELDEWAARFDAEGVTHSGAIDVPTGAILNFKDPDGIALALFWDR